MNRTTLIAVSSLALIATASVAQSVDDNVTRYMQNKTAAPALGIAEIATRDEMKAFAVDEFLSADMNVDGKIEESEFVAHLDKTLTATLGGSAAKADAQNQPQLKLEFAKIANGDQAITEKELITAREKAFDAADEDGSNALDPIERRKFTALVLALPEASSNDPI